MPTRTMRNRLRLGLLGAVCIAGAGGAQLPNASAAAAGLSGAYTARARGFNAAAWNPANLGMPGNPMFSIAALSFTGSAGLKPISLADIAPWGKPDADTVPTAVREGWL